MRALGRFLIGLSSRTANGIQRNIIKRSKRGAICRRYHAKDDKKAIAAWSLDLNRIQRVFDVRSVTPARSSLIARFQTELGVDTRVTGSDATNKHTAVTDVHRAVTTAETIVSGVRHDASNTKPIVSGVQSDVASTRTTPSDIHLGKLKSREGADGQNRVVSTTHTL